MRGGLSPRPAAAAYQPSVALARHWSPTLLRSGRRLLRTAVERRYASLCLPLPASAFTHTHTHTHSLSLFLSLSLSLARARALAHTYCVSVSVEQRSEMVGKMAGAPPTAQTLRKGAEFAGLDTYMYSPKDDRKHRAAWREVSLSPPPPPPSLSLSHAPSHCACVRVSVSYTQQQN